MAPVLAAVLLAAGCATVRQARDAQRGAAVPPGERTPAPAELGLASNRVLTLDEAVRLALAYHPSVVQASQTLAAAEAQARIAGAAARPRVDVSAGYSRATANAAGQPKSNRSRDGYSAAAGLDLLLYDFGRTPAAVREALARRDAASASLRAARNDAAFGVRTAFYNLGKAQELEQVAAEAVKQYRAHLDQVRAFAEVGRRIRYDVTKAEVDLGNAELGLINARNDVSNARAALCRGLGLAEDPGCAIAPAPAADAVPAPETLMDRARERHPALAALRAQERAASATVDQAVAALYPALSLRAQYGFAGSQFPLAWNWSAAVDAALSLFSGGRLTAQIEQATAQLRAARARVADAEQQVRQDLRVALNQLDSATQRLGVTDLIVRQARESLDLIDERYRLGAAAAVEVTDAQVALTTARADQVKARFDHLSAVAQIRHAIGEEAEP